MQKKGLHSQFDLDFKFTLKLKSEQINIKKFDDQITFLCPFKIEIGL